MKPLRAMKVTLSHYAQAIVTASNVAHLSASATLGQAINDFMNEHSRQWAGKTTKQNRAYLNILLEYFGPDRQLATITKHDAGDIKKALQALPSSRNIKPKGRQSRLRGHTTRG